MQISARGDYAVRAALELANAYPATISAQALADAQGLPRKFLEAVLGNLTDVFDPLQQAFGIFESVSDMCGGGLDGGMGGIMDQIESIMGIIDAIKPIADMISEMLG